MPTTAKGFPVPVDPVRPHIDLALADLAARIEQVLSTATDAELALLAGVDLWDGRYLMQTDVGAVRKWRGLYEYQTTGAFWRPMIPLSALTTFTPVLTATGTDPNLGVGATARGWYGRLGRLVIGRGSLQQGGASGYSVGSGTWLVSLPVAHDYTGQTRPLGRAFWNRNTVAVAGNVFAGVLIAQTATTAKITGTSSTGDLGSINVPFNTVPTPTGFLSYNFMYRGA
jgi:hypothetical protein